MFVGGLSIHLHPFTARHGTQETGEPSSFTQEGDDPLQGASEHEKRREMNVF